MSNTLIMITFVMSTVVFLALAVQNLYLYRLYLYGYLKIRNSKIIEVLTKLLLWKAVAFFFLFGVSVANLFQEKEVSLWLRFIGTFVFMIDFYYLYSFGKWSVEKENGKSQLL